MRYRLRTLLIAAAIALPVIALECYAFWGKHPEGLELFILLLILANAVAAVAITLLAWVLLWWLFPTLRFWLWIALGVLLPPLGIVMLLIWALGDKKDSTGPPSTSNT